MPNLLAFISLTDSLVTFNSVQTSLRVQGMQHMHILCPIQWSYDQCSCAAMPVASSKLKPSPLDQWPLKTKHSTGFSTITCVIPSILGLNVSVMIHLFHAYGSRTGNSVPLPSNGVTCTPKVRQNNFWYFVDLAGFNGGTTPSMWCHFGDQSSWLLDLHPL